MTLGEIKVITIEKMFLNDNPITVADLNAFENDTNYSIYLSKMISTFNEALQIIYSKAYPKYYKENGTYKKTEIEKIPNNATNEYEFKTYDEAVILIPFYTASQLYKDDDISVATQYRNEFEATINVLSDNIENSQVEIVFEMGCY